MKNGTDGKSRSEVGTYGMPVAEISSAAEERHKKAKKCAEESRKLTGLVGQSEPTLLKLLRD